MWHVFNIERQFALYGAYRNNGFNILVHVLCVWPMVLGIMVLLAYSVVLCGRPPWLDNLPLAITQHMIINYGFVIAALYALFYVALDRRAGFLAATLVMCCWMGGNMVAGQVPWETAWKMVLAGQVACCAAQFFGRGPHKIAPPNFLENIVQMLVMAPYFVLLELLHNFGYVPYRGFQARVQKSTGPHSRRRIRWEHRRGSDSSSSDSSCSDE